MRPAKSPWSALAPGRSRAIVKRESPVRPRRPAHLHVAEEHHAVRAPVLDRVREDVDVHERAPGLAGAELAQLAPGVAQAERGLPGVDAGAEELELEDRLDLADVGRDEALHAEAALADAGEEVAVLAELVLERRQLGRPHHVEPVRVVLLRSGSPCRAWRSRRCPGAARLGRDRSWPARRGCGRGAGAGSGPGRPSTAAARATADGRSSGHVSAVSVFVVTIPPCHFGLAFSQARTLRRASSNSRS